MNASLARRSFPVGYSANKTLQQSLLLTAVLLGTTAVSAYLFKGLALGIGGALGLFALSMGLIFSVYKLRNSGLAILALFAMAAVQGVALNPIVVKALASSSGMSALASAGISTLGIVFAAIAYIGITKRDFSKMGSALMFATIALIVTAVVNLFLGSSVLGTAVSAITVALFSGWLLYDLSNITNNRESNYILATLGLYLDMVNIFSALFNLFSDD